MRHRHLDTSAWTRAAIDSALEYGDLVDWRELFSAARKDRQVGAEILAVARAHPVQGASTVAERLVLALWPDLEGEHAA